MIFHEKFFQCLAGAIPLFLTPQKIGLLKQSSLNFQQQLQNMVVLNVKRSEKFLFLYETTLDSKVEAVLRDLIVLINLRLKVLRIVDALEGLAQHGIAKPPNMRGLLEEQIKELKLTDEEAVRCEPIGG